MACADVPGIPLPIWNAENRHTTPYPGDGGILFDLIPSLKPVPPA